MRRAISVAPSRRAISGAPSRRAVSGALLAALLAPALSACGRKGELERPPSEKAPPDEPPVESEAQDPVEPEAEDL